jgi:hypothetical protein
VLNTAVRIKLVKIERRKFLWGTMFRVNGRDESDYARGRRLLKLRIAMGFGDHGGSTRWAVNFLKLASQTRWSNVESGRYPLSRDLEDRIVRNCPGMTIDWLRYGDASGLSQMWLARLGLLGEAPRVLDT